MKFDSPPKRLFDKYQFVFCIELSIPRYISVVNVPIFIARNDFDLSEANDAIAFHCEMHNLSTDLKGLAGTSMQRLHELQLATLKMSTLDAVANAAGNADRNKKKREGDEDDEADGETDRIMK